VASEETSRKPNKHRDRALQLAAALSDARVFPGSSGTADGWPSADALLQQPDARAEAAKRVNFLRCLAAPGWSRPEGCAVPMPPWRVLYVDVVLRGGPLSIRRLHLWLMQGLAEGVDEDCDEQETPAQAGLLALAGCVPAEKPPSLADTAPQWFDVVWHASNPSMLKRAKAASHGDCAQLTLIVDSTADVQQFVADLEQCALRAEVAAQLELISTTNAEVPAGVLSRLRAECQAPPLPEGWFYTGKHYVNMEGDRQPDPPGLTMAVESWRAGEVYRQKKELVALEAVSARAVCTTDPALNGRESRLELPGVVLPRSPLLPPRPVTAAVSRSGAGAAQQLQLEAQRPSVPAVTARGSSASTAVRDTNEVRRRVPRPPSGEVSASAAVRRRAPQPPATDRAGSARNRARHGTTSAAATGTASGQGETAGAGPRPGRRTAPRSGDGAETQGGGHRRCLPASPGGIVGEEVGDDC
jgi:hypothetical protein